jgi:hypothetical protein
MDGPARVITRGRLDILIGTVLLAGALVALGFPVYLDSYDRWGIQIKCGTGYHSQLLQATIADQQPAQQSGPADYVDHCKSAVQHRRVWVLPVAGLGAVLLIPELVTWARGGSRSSGELTSAGPADLTGAEFHEAALLDRRYRSHRPPPHDTTL